MSDKVNVQISEPEKALNYILAGKSEFTLVSTKTGKRIKYKLIRVKSKYGLDTEYVYFIKLGDGSNQIFAGTLYFRPDVNRFTFSTGAKGLKKSDSVEVQALLYTVNALYNSNKNIGVEIYHAGKCGRCGRKLTTPESILTGLGPECSKIMNIPRIKI